MSLQKSAEFIADVERQAQWYMDKEGWELAERYLKAVEATCNLLISARQAGSVTRSLATGAFFWCSALSTNIYFFTNSPGTM